MSDTDSDYDSPPPRSPPRRKFKRSNSAAAQPTFAEGPTQILNDLSAKLSTTQGRAGSSMSEYHRMKSQISTEVQTTQARQEMKMRDLDTQLTVIQQKIKPQLQSVERQQTFTQDELSLLRSKFQSLLARDVTPTNQKFEKLGIKIDRFQKIEFEAKLRPLHDDVRSSRSILDDLKSMATTKFRQVEEDIGDLNRGIDTTTKELDSAQAKFDKRMESIIPKLKSLQKQTRDIQKGLDNGPQFNTSFQIIEKKLKDAQEAVTNLEHNVIPEALHEASDPLVEDIGRLVNRNDKSFAEVISEMEVIEAANNQGNIDRKNNEKNLEGLNTQSFELENTLSSIENETNIKIKGLIRDLQVNADQLKSQLQEMTSYSDEDDRTQGKIEDAVEDMKEYIDREIRELREEIRQKSTANMKSQIKAYSELTSVRNLVDGGDNIIGTLDEVEEQLDWCINIIQKVDAERLEAQRLGIAQEHLAKRARNVDERVTDAVLRLKRYNKEIEARERKRAREEEEAEAERRRKKASKVRNADEEEEEDNEEEEEEKPKPKRGRGSKKPKNYDDEDDEDEEEKPKPKRGRASKRANDDDDEDEKPKSDKTGKQRGNSKKEQPKEQPRKPKGKQKPSTNEDDEDEPPRKKRRTK